MFITGNGDQKRRYYVYVHIDQEGNVFYVGKGTGGRGWEAGEKQRHTLWHRYVEKFNGMFEVKIIEEQLNENEAEFLEQKLMGEYGGQLINWVNLSRDMDYEKNKKYWMLRKKNELLFAEAKEVEKNDIDKAIVLYIKCLSEMIYYETKYRLQEEYFSGIAAEIYSEWVSEDSAGKIEMLDRLTICLKKANRYEDIVSEVENYLRIFPGAKNRAGFKKILKRAKLI